MRKQKFKAISIVKTGLYLTCLLFVSLSPISSQAQGLTIPPGSGTQEYPGCATDVWSAIVNQSVLETRRESIINQRYIAKADSVIEYSCFETSLIFAAEHFGPIFNETEDFVETYSLTDGSAQIRSAGQPDYLDRALGSVVQATIGAYLENFNHGLLGEIAPVATPTSDPCNVMAMVWEAAKCKNFSGPGEFYEMVDLLTVEPRQFPAGAQWVCEP